MKSARALVKRYAPKGLREGVIALRTLLSAPPLEQLVLHDYKPSRDESGTSRATLVISSLAPDQVFGGVSTGVDIFFQLAAKLKAETRILIDDFDKEVDRALLEKSARRAGLSASDVRIEFRSAQAEPIAVRRSEVFFAYNWWTAINIGSVVAWQQSAFNLTERMPLIYIAQEYEPAFYPMSSTQMIARSAYESNGRTWAIVNSHELMRYFEAQGHVFDRQCVFAPTMSASLRSAISTTPLEKKRQILIYGRPQVPRNCFPPIVEALKLWSRQYGEAANWRVESAGMAHKTIDIGGGRGLNSLGKLSLEDYAKCLGQSAIGISLMSSPHPSYPPLEMAHFGVRTITNRYTCKDLSQYHDNIVSIPDIRPQTIAETLARLCAEFERDPALGSRGQSHMNSYMAGGDYQFLDEMAAALSGRLQPA